MKQDKEWPRVVVRPLVIMYEGEKEDGVRVEIHPAGYDYKVYGLLVCDLVRNVALAFDVDEDDVWKWVNKERDNPTTEVMRVS